MANWYYYNKNDEKVGPISATALKELARQGLITKETKLENGNGRSALAGQVNGLEFPMQPVSVTLPLPAPQVSANWHYYDAKGQKVGPIPFNVLQSLAANGVITPETSVETGDNVTTIAETIEGLTFAVVPPPIAPAAPPVTEDVYGFASPLPLAAPDPFASAPANPFATPQPATGNPFAGVPVAAAPAAVSLPTINRGKSQRIPVPAVGKKTQLPKPAIIVGIATAGVVLLLLLGVVISRMTIPAKIQITAEERAEVDRFIEEYGKDFNLGVAVEKGTVATVKYRISKGDDVRGDHIWPPLHRAAGRIDAEAIKIANLLISQGADVNLYDSTGPPLIVAINAGGAGEWLSMVELLVSQGADVNYRSPYHLETPLHEAASRGKLAIVKFLVSKGANVHAKTRDDKTPLDVARDSAMQEYLSSLQ